MKILTGTLVVLCLLVAASRAGAQAIVADHTSTADVAAIPDGAIPSAAAARLLVRNASVGGSIDFGLEALHGANAKYSWSLWDFQNRGNPTSPLWKPWKSQGRVKCTATRRAITTAPISLLLSSLTLGSAINP